MASDPTNNNNAPSAQDIIAEAQRRLQERKQESTASQAPKTWAARLNHGVLWLSQHWLALFNSIVGAYVTGAILAPVMMHLGHTGFGRVLYAWYAVACHQYPFRSWFLFGPALARPLAAPMSVLEMNQLSHFIGNADIGYKMALCQRDIAIYGIIFLAGVGYGWLRKEKILRPLPVWLYFIFGIMPIMLDGGIQWLSYVLWVLFPAWLNYPFETIPVMRVLTGMLFGFGIVAATYPHLDAYFTEVQETLEQKLRSI